MIYKFVGCIEPAEWIIAIFKRSQKPPQSILMGERSNRGHLNGRWCDASASHALYCTLLTATFRLRALVTFRTVNFSWKLLFAITIKPSTKLFGRKYTMRTLNLLVPFIPHLHDYQYIYNMSTFMVSGEPVRGPTCVGCPCDPRARVHWPIA